MPVIVERAKDLTHAQMRRRSLAWIVYLKHHGCYPDSEGNRPCDNGVLCDKCLTDDFTANFIRWCASKKIIPITRLEYARYVTCA